MLPHGVFPSAADALFHLGLLVEEAQHLGFLPGQRGTRGIRNALVAAVDKGRERRTVPKHIFSILLPPTTECTQKQPASSSASCRRTCSQKISKGATNRPITSTLTFQQGDTKNGTRQFSLQQVNNERVCTLGTN